MNDRWYEPKKNAPLKQRIKAVFASLASRLRGGQKGTGGGRGRPGFSESKAIQKLKSRLTSLFFAFGYWFQVSVLPILRRFDWRLIQGIAAVLVVSFFLANSLSTFAANTVMALTRSAGNKPKKVKAEGTGDDSLMTGPVSLGSPPKANTSSISRDIMTRNLFNSEGKIPDVAKDENKKVNKDLSLDFDNVPCTAGELPVQITGTIYTGDPRKSYVILKDPKITDADIYKPGDAIIDHEDFEIYKVERGTLEIRKGNSKICVAIKGYGKSDVLAGSGDGSMSGAKTPGDSQEFEFDAAFISQEIGPGQSNILNCARLIPDLEGGKMQGFKVLSIATSCLFDRIKLQNGDVITEVNGISLKEPTNAPKLYQALQEERTTTINILRNGEPITRTVRVK